MVCADCSFLVSRYGDDVNSAVARDFPKISRKPIHVHTIAEFEYRNALRFLVFRGKITSEQCLQWLAEYEADVNRGLLIPAQMSLPKAFAEAEKISTKHTETHGHRAYDILQVAAASLLGATDFWSFDGKQRTLAQAEGMKVGP
jgi:predicted nucleic acid-binding protein